MCIVNKEVKPDNTFRNHLRNLLNISEAANGSGLQAIGSRGYCKVTLQISRGLLYRACQLFDELPQIARKGEKAADGE
ncbi:hypothetical protein L1987_53573 [Smallanthus sonchifolius]|uniref:Uncharacterized protein n=1 Tax=Smallanthus sonchifolius TaxID=185202 RepID=A0ACB9EWW9_9ASTR|nr:hypothetical protein L1987_53573 [Smallanthus sonchifolius]